MIQRIDRLDTSCKDHGAISNLKLHGIIFQPGVDPMSPFERQVPRSLRCCLSALLIFACSSITVAQAQANGEPLIGVHQLPDVGSTQVAGVADSGSPWL